MDPQELQGLMEAYAEVYAPQEEIEEAVKGASRHDIEMRKAAASERRSGAKDRLSSSEGERNAAKMKRDIKFYDKITKKTKPSVVGMTHEEVEIFDVVLEFLQTLLKVSKVNSCHRAWGRMVVTTRRFFGEDVTARRVTELVSWRVTERPHVEQLNQPTRIECLTHVLPLPLLVGLSAT